MSRRLTRNFIAMLSLLFILSFLINGCNRSASFQFLNPAYEKMNQFSTTLLVMSLNNELFKKQQSVLSVGDTLKPLLLSREELTYFNNYMGPTFSEVAVADIIGIDPSFKVSEIKFIYNEFKTIGGNVLQIITPSSGRLSYNNITPDYVVFFEDLYFLKDYLEERTGIGRGTSSKYTLEAGLEYLIWDNRKEKIVGYGILEKSLNLFNFPAKENYLYIFEEFARAIINESPVAGKQIR